MKKISLFLVATTLIVFACTSKKENIGSKYINPENLTTQSFTINTTKDTVIKTSAGIKIKIDANSIEAATPTVTVKIKEALDINDILNAGLTTQTKDGILSSDGMFNIQTEEKSTIKKPLQIEVPTNAFDNEMQVYKGVEEDGQIVWQNPKSIEKQNKPDGKTLFIKNCASCHSIDKNLTGPALAWVEERWQGKDNLIAYIKNPFTFLKEPRIKSYDTIVTNTDYEKEHKAYRDWEYANFIYCEYKSNMTAFEGQLNDEQINAILDYIAIESKPLPKEEYPNTYDSCKLYQKMYEELVSHREDLLKSSKQPMVNKNQTIIPQNNTPIGNTSLPVVVNTKMQQEEFNATYYTFNIDTYGWYNVDKLYKDESYIESQLFVNIEKAETKRFQVYFVIPSLKVLVDGVLYDKKKYVFDTPNGKIKLPQGVDAYVFAIGEENQKTYFGLEHFITSQNQTINLKVEETDKEKIVSKMSSLKFDNFKFSIDTTKNYNELKTVDEELKQIELKIKGKCDCINNKKDSPATVVEDVGIESSTNYSISSNAKAILPK